MGCGVSTSAGSPVSVRAQGHVGHKQYPQQQHYQHQHHQQQQQQQQFYHQQQQQVPPHQQQVPPPHHQQQVPPPPQQQQQQFDRPIANVPPQQQNNSTSQQHNIPTTPEKQPPLVANDESDTGGADLEAVRYKPVDLNIDTLKRYIELEKKLLMYESQNIVRNLKLKQDTAKDVEQTLKQLEQHHQQCLTQTEKERSDVEKLQNPSVRAYFHTQESFDTQMSKEQEEYLEALNKQEIAEKELHGVREQHEKLVKEVESLKSEAENLYKIYQEQDELLAGIFDGNYGSQLENKLESELDLLLDKKQRIAIAKYKWTNGRVLLAHAVNQLAFATKRWADVLQTPQTNQQLRYQVATETRNNLMAASQNITAAQRYLNNIPFPYCKPDEIKTLERATENIYIDLQNIDRHKHAWQCYIVTYKRCAALVQWFDYVIQTTIDKDIESATLNCKTKEKELRNERLSLIKAKIEEVQGEGAVDLNLGDDEFTVLKSSEDQSHDVMLLFTADDVSHAGDLQSGDDAAPDISKTDETVDEDVSDSAPVAADIPAGGAAIDQTPSPLPLSELAPAPTQEDLFGDISALQAQHEQQMEDFQRAQEMNKLRMDQGLQEKLRARRSRKKREQSSSDQ